MPLLATLAAGLPAESQSKMAIAGQSVPPDQYLLMAIFDQLNLLLWTKTKDGQKGRNRPKPLIDAANKQKKKPKERIFRTGEEFRKEYKRICKLIERG